MWATHLSNTGPGYYKFPHFLSNSADVASVFSFVITGGVV